MDREPELEGPDTLVFVYGTLMSGQVRNDCMRTPRTRFICKDTIPGRIHSMMGAYPVLDAGPPGEVRGEVWSVPEGIVLHVLDHIEGYDPSHPLQGLYLRRPVVTGAGHQAQVYMAGPRLKSRLSQFPLIRSGDWEAFHQTMSQEEL